MILDDRHESIAGDPSNPRKLIDPQTNDQPTEQWLYLAHVELESEVLESEKEDSN